MFIFLDGGFKGKRKKSLFVSITVKPHYHKVKRIKSHFKSLAKQRMRMKENNSSMHLKHIKSPVLIFKCWPPSPCKHIMFLPLRKKQRTKKIKPMFTQVLASSTPKKSKRRLINDHNYCKDGSFTVHGATLKESFEIDLSDWQSSNSQIIVKRKPDKYRLW